MEAFVNSIVVLNYNYRSKAKKHEFISTYLKICLFALEFISTYYIIQLYNNACDRIVTPSNSKESFCVADDVVVI